MSESTKSFRTSADLERTRRAAEVVARARAAVTAAQTEASATERACVADPNTKAFEKMKAARGVLDDAEAALVLAEDHAAQVEREIATAERDAISREIARREASLTEVVDDEALERAVDIERRSLELRERTEARSAQRHSEIRQLNELRAQIGAVSEEVPTVARMIVEATVQIGEIVLSAQAMSGAGPAGSLWPQWREGGRLRRFLTGREELLVIRTMPDGTQETAGRDGTHVVRRAAEVLERLEARRATVEKGSVAGVATKAAAVATMGVLAAFTFVWG